MNIARLRLVRLGAAALTCALAIGLAGCGGGGGAGADAQVVARVGSETISRPQLDAAAADLAARSGELAPGAERLGALRAEALRTMILDAELRLEAERLGIQVTDEEVQAALFSQAGSDPLAPQPTALERQRMRDRLTQERLRARLASGTEQPSAAEITRFFDSHRTLFDRPASRAVIYLRAAERDVLAGLLSDGPRTDLSGAIGADGVTGGQLAYTAGADRALDRRILSAPVGTVIGPLREASGAWALIQPRDQVIPASSPTLAQVRGQVAQLIIDQQVADRWSEFTSEAAARYQPQVEVDDEAAGVPEDASEPAPVTTTP